MNRLIEENLDLVEIIAAQFKTDDLDFEELVGEGRLALVRAAKSFDRKKGIQFRTYATTVIKNHLLNSLDKIRFLDCDHLSENTLFEEDLELTIISKDLVKKLLSELSITNRNIVKLWFGIDSEAFSPEEIAEILSLSIGMIYKSKYCSVKKIKEILKKNELNGSKNC